MFTRKTEKPLLGRHSKPSPISFGLKYFVSRGEINVWIVFRIKKIITQCERLYDIDSNFMSGVILALFLGN